MPRETDSGARPTGFWAGGCQKYSNTDRGADIGAQRCQGATSFRQPIPASVRGSTAVLLQIVNAALSAVEQLLVLVGPIYHPGRRQSAAQGRRGYRSR
jgi:hypothetical protein